MRRPLPLRTAGPQPWRASKDRVHRAVTLGDGQWQAPLESRWRVPDRRLPHRRAAVGVMKDARQVSPRDRGVGVAYLPIRRYGRVDGQHRLLGVHGELTADRIGVAEQRPGERFVDGGFTRMPGFRQRPTLHRSHADGVEEAGSGGCKRELEPEGLAAADRGASRRGVSRRDPSWSGSQPEANVIRPVSSIATVRRYTIKSCGGSPASSRRNAGPSSYWNPTRTMASSCGIPSREVSACRKDGMCGKARWR
jgi:hypothetical protein